MYQIFPDRFCASGTAKGPLPADRALHEAWGEQPQWRPNAQGRVTNSDFFGGDLKGIEQDVYKRQEIALGKAGAGKYRLQIVQQLLRDLSALCRHAAG